MADDKTGTDETSTRIRVRGADGKWRDLTVEPRKTGDSELDELWQMSFGEFEKIVEDPEHPLHGKALEVQREAIKPITDALSELTRPITESLAKSFDFSSFSKAIAPKIDFSPVLPKMDASSWFAKMLPETSALSIPGGSVDLATSLSAPSIPASEVMSPVVAPSVIDFDDVEPPDVSLSEIAGASDAKAHEIRVRQVEILTDLLAQARADSESSQQALAVAQRSKAAAWVAAWAAIAAAVIGIVGIGITVLLQ